MSEETGREKERHRGTGARNELGIKFIGSAVEVEYVQEPGFKRPLRLKWDGEEATVEEILSRWDDWGFGATPPRRRHWWQRRHRTCYRVRSTDGRTLELYYDRSARKWFITREILK